MPLLPISTASAMQAYKTMISRGEEPSPTPSTTPTPDPEANFIPLYVFIALIPLTFLSIGLYTYRLERKAKQAQSREIELQTLRSHWFPWREAIDIASPTTLTPRTTIIKGANSPTLLNTHPVPKITNTTAPDSASSFDRPAAVFSQKTNTRTENAHPTESTTNLLSRLHAGEATTTLPTSAKDWYSVHAALLPHRFGRSRKPDAKSSGAAARSARPGGPRSPTITAPSFIGSTVSIAGPSEPRTSRVEETPAVGEGGLVVTEASDDEYEGKGKGKATAKVTTKPAMINRNNEDMF